MPLIVMLILIGIISAITIGIQITNNKNKQLAETKGNTEQISAAVDIAATDIGTNTKATFTVSTGEIHIYNSSSSNSATMDKTKWHNFHKKIVTADGNLNAVKTITFDDIVYAPANSSNLFFYGGNRLEQLVTINNLSKLNTSKVTNMEDMFYGCSKLTEINIKEWEITKVTNASGMFAGCNSLIKFVQPDNRLVCW